MKLNASRNQNNRHLASLCKTISKRLNEEISNNPMATDNVLIEIVEEIVNDKIDLIQIIGRRDTNKESIIKEIKIACAEIKKGVRNRFRKKPLQFVDITLSERLE